MREFKRRGGLIMLRFARDSLLNCFSKLGPLLFAATAQTKAAVLQAFAESSVVSAEDKASAIAEWKKQVFGM